MKSHCKWIAGLGASAALALGGVGCSDSGDKRMVADSTGSSDRSSSTVSSVSNQPGTATASVAPSYGTPPSNTGNTYYESTHDADQPRRIVRVSATDPEIRGTTATATYDAAPRSNSNLNSDRPRPTMVVQEAPPLTPPEIAPTPGPNEFWVNGHWRVENNRYVWEPGRMENLRSRELYHPAKWTQTDQGWEFTPAYWD